MFKKIACIAILGMASSSAFAEVTSMTKSGDPVQKQMAVNLEGLSFSSGIAGNYEYLLNNSHGFIAEGSAALWGDLSSYRVGAGYRYHFTPSMESFFMGTYLSYGSSSGEVTENSVKYKFDANITKYGVNIGKRWVWDNGINLVARIGGGGSSVDIEYNQDAKPGSDKLVEDVLGLLSKVDGELSVGYVF